MSRTSAGLADLKKWYHELARPFLQQHEPDRITEFDGDLHRLERSFQQLDSELAACFLGSSGVGKSTLINALVAGRDQVVPSGGIGPLTAQALTIRFGTSQGFRATYHPAKHVNQLAFALQHAGKGKLEKSPMEDSLDFEQIDEAETAPDPSSMDSFDGAAPAMSRTDQYKRQARLMVTGRQDGDEDVAYLVDGLRAAMGQSLLSRTDFRQDDLKRIDRLKRRLSSASDSARFKCEKTADEEGFYEALAEHATGFLAPIIEKLDVEWHSALLDQGLSLVDLPGLGIDGDVYREVTRKWITERAKAVVLVVDHRGITDANAQLLRTSGFLNRLLHSADDPSSDPVSLIVVVVKIDDIADSRRMNDKAKARSRREYFIDVQRESQIHIEGQIRAQLEAAWVLEGDTPSDAKRRVIDRITSELRVYPLSAIQYRKCLANDEDDPPFIKQPAESGVPAMIAGLKELSEQEKEERRARFRDAKNIFDTRLFSVLERIQTRWQEETQASDDAERLRGELLTFLQPLREEFRVRQGAFREFLKEALPKRIEGLVDSAKLTSGKKIRLILRGLRDAHWKTLQATVRRGGAYHGAKHIELPRDFALTFEEPIAEVWGETVLKEIRQRTSEYADDCVDLVDRLAEWAKGQGTSVRPKLVESQRDAIRADATRLKSVGRVMVNDLREQVTSKLIQAIEPPIRRKCNSFVQANKDIGTGVRNRILELFDELAEDALDSAVKPARTILLECYRQVEAEIREVFEQNQDPLKTASEAIVETHESRIRRSDAKKRAAVLDQISIVLANHPTPTESAENHLRQGA